MHLEKLQVISIKIIIQEIKMKYLFKIFKWKLEPR
jgi:hypothetical protein